MVGREIRISYVWENYKNKEKDLFPFLLAIFWCWKRTVAFLMQKFHGLYGLQIQMNEQKTIVASDRNYR